MVQLDDLGMVEVFPGDLGQVYHQDGAQGEVGRRYDADLAGLGQLFHLVEVSGGETGRADDHVHIISRGGAHRRHRGPGDGEIDDDIRPAALDEQPQCRSKRARCPSRPAGKAAPW